MKMRFEALPSDWVSAIRAGGPDANGQPARQGTSDGSGLPCRHCLQDIPDGKSMLTLAARPFPTLQPYAETGPIFLCAECERFDGKDCPSILTTRPSFLIKGYDQNDRIVEGTGKHVLQAELRTYCETLLTSPDIAYLHIRSATNNCYFAKVVRHDGGET